MTQSALTLGVAIVLVLTLAHLVFALAKRKAIIGGRFITRDHSPIVYWLWLVFDVFALVFCGLLILEMLGVGVR